MATRAGKVAPIPRDAWNNATSYEKLNIVSHNGYVYMAKQDNVGHEPVAASSDSYWMLLVSGGVVSVDSAMSSTSTNPVQNKVITEAMKAGTIPLSSTMHIGGETQTTTQQALEALEEADDEYTPLATCRTENSLTIVDFDNLNPDYGYDINYEVPSSATTITVPTWTNVVQSVGTNTGTIKLTYTLSGATAGTDQFSLRIKK